MKYRLFKFKKSLLASQNPSPVPSLQRAGSRLVLSEYFQDMESSVHVESVAQVFLNFALEIYLKSNLL